MIAYVEIFTHGKWMDFKYKAFKDIKNIPTEEKMLLFPKLDVKFNINTIASDFQLRGVV